MNKYRLSKDAEDDLIEIARYAATEANLEIAEQLLAEIIDCIILLATHPKAGRMEERYGRGIRSFPNKNFKIYYRPIRSGILILHIFHGSRDQAKAWKGGK